jgi:hypothetical protein
MFFKWINQKLAEKFKKETKPSAHREMTLESYQRFQSNGEGIYYCNVKGKSNTITAKLIEFFAHKLTHSFAVLFSNDLRSWFTDEQWKKLCDRWNYHYGVTTGIPSTVKALILGSADQDGINIMDYSAYQSREHSIRKAPLNSIQIKKLLEFVCQDKILNANYDYVGLALHLISRKLQDKTAWYCSELVYDSFMAIGVKTAKKPYPTPYELECYNKEWIIWSNL